MYMTTHEIVQMYKEAADKDAQIEILADLNVCSKKEIISILESEGAISGIKKKMQNYGGHESCEAFGERRNTEATLNFSDRK